MKMNLGRAINTKRVTSSYGASSAENRAKRERDAGIAEQARNAPDAFDALVRAAKANTFRSLLGGSRASAFFSRPVGRTI